MGIISSLSTFVLWEFFFEASLDYDVDDHRQASLSGDHTSMVFRALGKWELNRNGILEENDRYHSYPEEPHAYLPYKSVVSICVYGRRMSLRQGGGPRVLSNPGACHDFFCWTL